MKTTEQDSGAGLGSDLVLALNDRVTADSNWAAAGGTSRADDSGRTSHVRAVADESIALSTLQAHERELLALADGRRSVEELIRLSGMAAENARKHLRSLRDRGILVQVSPPARDDAKEKGGEQGNETSVTTSPGRGDGLGHHQTDSGGPPSPEDTEGDAVGDGSSALTKAIDEYLELAASAMTSAATEPVEAAVENTEGNSTGDESGITTTLPGLMRDSGPATHQKQNPHPSQADQSGRHQQAVFRPNVTAFWTPAMLEGVGNPASAVAKDAASDVSGRGMSRSEASASSLAATVVVRGTPAAGSSPTTDAAAPPGPRSSTKMDSGGAAPSPSSSSSSSSSPAQPLTSAPIPFRVGDYEVATRIAQGGMGSIYVCRRAGEAGFQRLFTLKVVRQHSAKREEAVQSFRREAHVGSLLSHPNLQTVLDVGSYKDQPFLVLDYVEGTSLSELLSDDRRSPVPVVVAILLDILRGLHHAHQLVDDKGVRLGVVHADISPQNVLVGVDGRARLTDFGSATFTGEGRLHDPKWKATGKPAYMAPEQLRAEPLDARTDVFAVGVLMWSVLTGQKLFAGDTYDETIMKVLRKKIPPPSALGAPAYFDDVCLKALSRSKEGRYGSADEMARDLSRVASNENVIASAADVGLWVRRESGEGLNEQRRRIQLMFGTVKVATGRVDPSAAAGKAVGPTVPGRAAPPTIVLDGMQRNLHTPKLGRNQALSPRTVSLGILGRPQKTFWRTWNVVIVSALLALPVTLTIGYFISNLLVAQQPPPTPAAQAADAATSH